MRLEQRAQENAISKEEETKVRNWQSKGKRGGEWKGLMQQNFCPNIFW